MSSSRAPTDFHSGSEAGAEAHDSTAPGGASAPR